MKKNVPLQYLTSPRKKIGLSITPIPINIWLIIPELLTERIKRKIEATTTHDIKWGKYTIVCTVFLNARFVISFSNNEIITAAPVLRINLTIESSNVLRRYYLQQDTS